MLNMYFRKEVFISHIFFLYTPFTFTINLIIYAFYFIRISMNDEIKYSINIFS